MIRREMYTRAGLLSALFVVIWLLPVIALAHCDTLDGPVIAAARAAFEKGDVTPVLKWVQKDNETEIKDLFNKTMLVRNKGKDARELAEMYFFETLVRIHRAGEGASYTGLKPAGQVEPSIAAADKAIEIGSADGLVKMMNDAASRGIRERFDKVRETKKHADESIEAGRKYVAAYVDFTHYVERLHNDASSGAEHHQEKAQTERKKDHEERQHEHK